MLGQEAESLAHCITQRRSQKVRTVKTARWTRVPKRGIRLLWEGWHLRWPAGTGRQAHCHPRWSTAMASSSTSAHARLCTSPVLSTPAPADLRPHLLESPAWGSHCPLGQLTGFLCHHSCPQHCFIIPLPGMEASTRVPVWWGRERLPELSRYLIN